MWRVSLFPLTTGMISCLPWRGTWWCHRCKKILFWMDYVGDSGLQMEVQLGNKKSQYLTLLQHNRNSVLNGQITIGWGKWPSHGLAFFIWMNNHCDHVPPSATFSCDWWNETVAASPRMTETSQELQYFVCFHKNTVVKVNVFLSSEISIIRISQRTEITICSSFAKPTSACGGGGGHHVYHWWSSFMCVFHSYI